MLGCQIDQVFTWKFTVPIDLRSLWCRLYKIRPWMNIDLHLFGTHFYFVEWLTFQSTPHFPMVEDLGHMFVLLEESTIDLQPGAQSVVYPCEGQVLHAHGKCGLWGWLDILLRWRWKLWCSGNPHSEATRNMIRMLYLFIRHFAWIW